jgi:hypothetical protein
MQHIQTSLQHFCISEDTYKKYNLTHLLSLICHSNLSDDCKARNLIFVTAMMCFKPHHPMWYKHYDNGANMHNCIHFYCPPHLYNGAVSHYQHLCALDAWLVHIIKQKYQQSRCYHKLKPRLQFIKLELIFACITSNQQALCLVSANA